MELRRLRYFVAVAEELSFTRAAERLHIAQPPLSIQIRALEQEIGARLFDRDQRHVYLTQAGKHLLDRARRILESVEAAKAEVRCAALGEVGALNVGYASSAMFTSSLTSAIKAFKKELTAYKGGKGSVQFPFDEPLPLALVSRIVKFRVKQSLSRKKK